MPEYKGLLDMLDGGGAGRSGQTFEGGPLSGILNALGIRPMGFRDRQAAARPMPRPMMAPQPAMPSGGAPVGPVTTQPLIGSLTTADILDAIQRGAPAPYVQPTMPMRMPTLQEIMEAEDLRRRRQAGIDLQMGFGNVFPQFTTEQY